MAAIEAGVRGGGIAVLLLLALFVWRDMHGAFVARYYALFMLSGICYLIESAPGLTTIDPAWLMPARFLSNISPALFQLWARATFDDSFKPSRLAWLPAAAMAVVTGWAMTTHQWAAWRLVQIAALLFACAGIWHVLAGRQADLVEARRRLRLVLAMVVGLVIAGLTLHGALTSPLLRAQNSLLTAGIVLGLALASAVLQLGVRFRPGHAVASAGDAAPVPPSVAPVAIDPGERALLDRLQRLMEEDRIYREEGLGIAGLAARMGLPEYRLRRLINQRLGHRNFTSFISGYRLAETMAALADPAQAQVPVLTIALDAGFQSIGPFNRAFKAQTGMTPTDYRRERLEQAPPRAAE